LVIPPQFQKTVLFRLLDDIAFFDVFEADEISDLMTVASWEEASTGRRIIREGELDLRMFVLLKGTADVLFRGKAIAGLQTGDIFGEVGLMGAPRIAHVEARTDCLLLAFDADDLNRLSPVLQVKFLRRVLGAVFARLQKANVQKWMQSNVRKARDGSDTLELIPPEATAGEPGDRD
jgi:CRP-like cAMP-binding protein